MGTIPYFVEGPVEYCGAIKFIFRKGASTRDKRFKSKGLIARRWWVADLRTVTSDRTVYNNSSLSSLNSSALHDISGWKWLRSNKFIIYLSIYLKLRKYCNFLWTKSSRPAQEMKRSIRKIIFLFQTNLFSSVRLLIEHGKRNPTELHSDWFNHNFVNNFNKTIRLFFKICI